MTLNLVSGNDFKALVLDRHYSNILSENERQAIRQLLLVDFHDVVKYTQLTDYCQNDVMSQTLSVHSSQILLLLLLTFKSLRERRMRKLEMILNIQE